ncbi:uncharacterized protein BYT42DRAFT_580041 [Radiomyces spectabilis]|uniref:uncharacterized protein n=1 Tax=Radiomyces spectabilis TaxID=64574 RepID=UPI00221E4FFE|nr:uncharacterized protein BYT42DRAFT_580041 [Radiomyces spectabilis]KAI8371381.1 hypothetical protein BYT42DRAFT_580041 [Radiomyces spectabilis]
MSRQFGPRSVRSYQNLHNRSALLGDTSRTWTPSPSSHMFNSASTPGSSPERSYKVKMDDGDLEHLESQSDERITGLSAKVKLLKTITGKIGDEIKHGNSIIDTMNDQFSNTGGILGKTMRNFKVMAEKESGATMCYLMFFVIVMVILLYYWFFR